MSRITLLAALLGSLAMVAPAPADAPLKTRIKVDVPAKVHVGKSFLAEADVQLDYRLHRPPYDYLKAAMYYAGNVAKCPKALPATKKAWHLVADYDYAQSGSVRVGFGTSLTFEKPGSHRFCAYVYLDHYRPGDFQPSSQPVKARASKLVTAK